MGTVTEAQASCHLRLPSQSDVPGQDWLPLMPDLRLLDWGYKLRLVAAWGCLARDRPATAFWRYMDIIL